MTTTPREKIFELITEAHQHNELDSSITPEMVPALAEALEPHLNRYQAKQDAWPGPKIFRAMVNNFIQDGPLVQALSAVNSPDAPELWRQLRANLLAQAQRKWPGIGSSYQEEIVDRALVRIARYLPDFLFLARLSTWTFKILINEYLRLAEKIKAKQKIELSLDEETAEGITIGQQLSSPMPDPEEIAERKQTTADLNIRITQLGNELEVTILRWHLAGYTLEEIKAKLGQDAPSVATINRYKGRLLKRIQADPVIREIARQLGIGSVVDDDDNEGS